MGTAFGGLPGIFNVHGYRAFLFRATAMDILLEGGWFDGRRVKVFPGERQFRLLWDDRRLIYETTGRRDAKSGLPIFTLKEESGPVETSHAGA
jgi:hypothetical protein